MEKRTLRIEPVPATSLVRIAWNGGGELPEALKGYYTSNKDAKRAIDVWSINNQRPEVVEIPKDPRDDEDPKKLVVKTEDIEGEGAVTDEAKIEEHLTATKKKVEKKPVGRPRKE